MDSVIALDDNPVSGALSRTLFYALDWRGDVMGTLNFDGSSREHVRYSAYGRPFTLQTSDWDGNVVHEIGDIFVYQGVWSASSAWTDFNMDGTRDIGNDTGHYLNAWFAQP